MVFVCRWCRDDSNPFRAENVWTRFPKYPHSRLRRGHFVLRGRDGYAEGVAWNYANGVVSISPRQRRCVELRRRRCINQPRVGARNERLPWVNAPSRHLPQRGFIIAMFLRAVLIQPVPGRSSVWAWSQGRCSFLASTVGLSDSTPSAYRTIAYLLQFSVHHPSIARLITFP